jgi:hypothetical protein
MSLGDWARGLRTSRPPGKQKPSPNYTTPAPDDCPPCAPRPWGHTLWGGGCAGGAPTPFPQVGIRRTGCPTGQPEGWGTGIGRGARRRSHTRRYQSTGAGVPLPQRVALTPQPEVTLPRRPRQRLRRHALPGGCRRALARLAGRRRCRGGRGHRDRQRLGDEPPQPYQQIHRRRVQGQPEVVGHEAMVAQPVHRQVALELLIPVFALSPSGVLVVGRPREHHGPRPVRHHEAAVGAPVVGLRLGHDPARLRPRPRLIPEAREQPRRHRRSWWSA